MEIKVSENFSFVGWNIVKYILGRKKLAITILGIVCAKLALDPDMTGLLVGGVVFEGVWAIAEYYFKRVNLKRKSIQ